MWDPFTATEASESGPSFCRRVLGTGRSWHLGRRLALGAHRTASAKAQRRQVGCLLGLRLMSSLGVEGVQNRTRPAPPFCFEPRHCLIERRARYDRLPRGRGLQPAYGREDATLDDGRVHEHESTGLRASAPFCEPLSPTRAGWLLTWIHYQNTSCKGHPGALRHELVGGFNDALVVDVRARIAALQTHQGRATSIVGEGVHGSYQAKTARRGGTLRARSEACRGSSKGFNRRRANRERRGADRRPDTPPSDANRRRPRLSARAPCARTSCVPPSRTNRACP
jgi:hypothetical protein